MNVIGATRTYLRCVVGLYVLEIIVRALSMNPDGTPVTITVSPITDTIAIALRAALAGWGLRVLLRLS